MTHKTKILINLNSTQTNINIYPQIYGASQNIITQASIKIGHFYLKMISVKVSPVTYTEKRTTGLLPDS